MLHCPTTTAKLLATLVAVLIFFSETVYANVANVAKGKRRRSSSAALVSTTLSGATAEERLAECSEKIEQLLRSWNRGKVGVLVQTDDNETIFTKYPNDLFKPASNLKLITSAVALERLGADFKYRTDFFIDGYIKDGVLHGNLILAGTTDPLLSGFFDRDINDITREWADTFTMLGITKIVGDVILDNSYYVGNKTPIVNGEPIRFATMASFKRASESQLNKVSTVRTIKTKSGQKRVVRRGFRRRSRLKMVSIEPNTYCANALLSELQSRGMIDDDKTLKKITYSKTLDRTAWKHIYTYFSLSLYQALKITNKSSDNFYADQLLRTLGGEFYGEGTIEKGLEVVKEFLVKNVGVARKEFQLSDGSGLSHSNTVTPHLIIEVMRYMRLHGKYFKEYYNSLAVPMAEGTLIGRIHHPLAQNIRAKTGSITGVSSLSGYLTSRSGKQIYFAIIGNGSGRRYSRNFARVEDTICKLLLEI